MKLLDKISRKQLESLTRVAGICCLVFAVYNQTRKTDGNNVQELSFWFAIAGIVFLSISYNVRMRPRNLSFLQRNKVILPFMIVTILIVIVWIVTNYIIF